MTTSKDIYSLINQLGATNYQAPSWYKGYQSGFTPVDRSMPQGAPVNFKPSDFPSLKTGNKGGSGISLFDILSGTIGQFGGVVTDSMHKQLMTIKDKKKGTGEKLLDLLLKDSIGVSVAGGVKNGAKEQWKDWTDGKLSWGDIPGVGFLHGADKGYKRGVDLVTDSGMADHLNDKWAQNPVTNFIAKGDNTFLKKVPLVHYIPEMAKGIMESDASKTNNFTKNLIGIGIDIGADPLTYLTGGVTAATKASKVAEMAKVSELAKGLGITGKVKDANELRIAAEQVYRAKYGKYPNLSDKMVAKKLDELDTHIRTARNEAYNSNVNTWGLSVPFTNKYGKIGNIGEKNILHRTETVLGDSHAHLAEDLIHKAAQGNDVIKADLTKLIQERYKIDSFANMSKQQFDDLTKHLNPVIAQYASKGIPDVVTSSKVTEHAMPQADFDRLMTAFKDQNIHWKDVEKQLEQILQQTGHDPILRSSYGHQLAKMVEDFWLKKSNRARKVTNKEEALLKSESMGWASRFLGESDKYKTVEHTVEKVHANGTPHGNQMRDAREFAKQTKKLKETKYSEMMDGKTRFEHFLNKHNVFSSRTLANKDQFVNSMGDHISDANSQRVGETAMYSRTLNKMEKFLKTNAKSEKEKQQLMQHAIYHLENHAPDELHTWKTITTKNGKTKKVIDKKWQASDKVKELAGLIKPALDHIAKSEQKAGVLGKTRANYFPHITNKEQKVMDEVQAFMDRHPELSGLKKTNKFNQERKGFQTLAERDNFLKKLEKAIQKETVPAKLETLRKQQEHVANMFNTDVVSALQRRVRESARSKSMNAMQGELHKYGMMKSINYGDSIPEGHIKLEPDVANKLGLKVEDGKQYTMHKDVLDGMKRVDEVFTNEGMNKVVRAISAISDIWRPFVTYYKPSHYVNNLIGNVINNSAAGVRVRDYKVAAKLLKGWKDGTLTPAEMKFMEKAYKHNTVSSGYLIDSQPTFSFKEKTGLEKAADKVANNRVASSIRHKGEFFDDISRLANYVNGVDKFGSHSRAAAQVRKYLFNYNELTNADRAMRAVVPFWNWTKNNLPLQMKILMENPEFPLNIERMKKVFNDGQEGQDWQKESGIKIPGMPYYMSIPSPTNDLKMLANPRDFMGGITPALRMPTEMMLNKKFFTGKPISYGSNEMQPEDLPQYLMSNFGIGGNAYDAFSGKRSVGETLFNLFKNVSKIKE